MKVQVFRGESEWGTAEVVDEKVKLEGSADFKAFIKKLVQPKTSAADFVQSLPIRLRSFISAIALPETADAQFTEFQPFELTVGGTHIATLTSEEEFLEFAAVVARDPGGFWRSQNGQFADPPGIGKDPNVKIQWGKRHQAWSKTSSDPKSPANSKPKAEPKPSPSEPKNQSTPKPEPTPEPKPERKPPPEGVKTEYARTWEKSWDNAPADLQAVLKVIDEPKQIKTASGSDAGAYYQSGGIFMGGFPDDTPQSRAVWRHEYGHLLDDKLSRHAARKSLDQEFQKHGISSVAQYDRMLDGDDETFSKAKAARKEVVAAFGGDPDDLHTVDSLLGLAAKSKNGSTTAKGYISSSTAGNAAFREDEKYLLDWQAKSQARHLATYDADLEKYSKRPMVKIMQNRSAEPAEIAAEIARLKFHDSVKEEVEAALPNTRRKSRTDAEVDQKRSEIIASRVAQLDQDSIAVKLYKQIDKPDSNLAARLVQNPDAPQTIAMLAEHVFQSDAIVQDLLGSITRNKVGRGHSDAYYEKDPMHSQNTEAFANLVSVYGSGHPLAGEVLQRLSPSGFQFLKNTLKQVQDEE